jgi:hypothetical protein
MCEGGKDMGEVKEEDKTYNIVNNSFPHPPRDTDKRYTVQRKEGCEC